MQLIYCPKCKEAIGTGGIGGSHIKDGKTHVAKVLEVKDEPIPRDPAGVTDFLKSLTKKYKSKFK